MKASHKETIVELLIFVIVLTIVLSIADRESQKKIPAHHKSIINAEKMKCEIDELPKKECLAALNKRIYRPTIQEMDDNPE